MRKVKNFFQNVIKYQSKESARLLTLDQDIRFGLFLILFSGVLVWQVSALTPSSAMYPKALIYLTAFSGMGIVYSACRSVEKSGTSYRKLSRREFLFESGLPGAVLLAFYALADFLGFYIVSFLVIVVIVFLQEYIVEGRCRFGRKSLVETLVFALVSTILLYVSFSYMLSLPTPTGVFGF